MDGQARTLLNELKATSVVKNKKIFVQTITRDSVKGELGGLLLPILSEGEEFFSRNYVSTSSTH